jgi:putative endonuclease
MNWIVYILLCSDGTYYTGITTNLEARVEKHSNGTGAKYTRGRGPFTCVYVSENMDKSSALKEEYRIKQLSTRHKIELIQSWKF